MKISIDTLPLWDAFRETGDCPHCRLQERMEAQFIDTYLGESVMEPDVRVEVNAKGFCPRHYALLFQQKTSKLGLALMTHTHLKETISALERDTDALTKQLDAADTPVKRAAGARSLDASLKELSESAARRALSCAVCERVELHMARYFETAYSMWEHDSDFRRLFEQTPGFCLPHWGKQLEACKGVLGGKKKQEFIRLMVDMEKKALSELEKDLEWFTRKFDYRNTDKPWGNSKDALPRAINVLEGKIVGNE